MRCASDAAGRRRRRRRADGDQPDADGRAERRRRATRPRRVPRDGGLIPGLRLDPNAASDLAISVSDDTHDGQYRRATIRFSGWSRTYFGGILGIAELAVNGSAGSMAKRAPDIDFYVMLDTSSSMALPTTSAGIALMRAKTKDVDPFNPRGCAFACHQIDPDKPRLVDRDGKKIDYYQLAHDNGIELRIDAGKRAILDLLGMPSGKPGERRDLSLFRFHLRPGQRLPQRRTADRRLCACQGRDVGGDHHRGRYQSGAFRPADRA